MSVSAQRIAELFGETANERLAALLETDPARTIMDVFNAGNVSTRIVGGAVRNALSGSGKSDIDCATDATPYRITDMAEAAGLKAVGTGIDHGTVTVLVDGKPVEITTLRADVETDGRHAKVAFGTDWTADAQRRDFTVNALYLDAEGTVHDPLGGMDDIAARRLRFIGDPAERIAEDYLRVLRLFRFAATFGGTPQAQDLAAVVRALPGLARLSAERVGKELLTLLAASDSVPALDLMQSHGVLTEILDCAPSPGRVARFLALEQAMGWEPDPVLRLGALAMHHAGDAGRLQERLRLSNAQTERLRAVFDGWWQVDAGMDEANRKVAIYRSGPDAARDRLAVAWLQAREAEPSAKWIKAIQLAQEWVPPKFPLSGKDLMAAGVAAGPQIGQRLAELEETWIASGFSLDRDALLAQL
ncbi:CCA tRNA nucleotidyltransferase [Tepidamorphus sp. 3E244]|uniref:CCA tRNA nucleotidyltransferase n=1 Tax=Tepidamorphus sp. 3E244 TaxID=3385498 RepID=UPI0038FC0468